MEDAYPTDDILIVGEVSPAILAAVDLVAGEIDVVGQTHGGGTSWSLIETE